MEPNQLSEISTAATSAMATTVVPAMMYRMGQARVKREIVAWIGRPVWQ